MIAIIGSDGSMGKRYQAILKFLGEELMCFDKHTGSVKEIISQASKCGRIIIASPTNTHVEYLKELLPLKIPILCEKPITKNLNELEELHAFCARTGVKYDMVYQYKEIPYTTEPGRISHYNYFRHGSDGLAWDCIQIIALARGPIKLRQDSPTWECVINGKTMNIRDMDYAYIAMIKKWLTGSLDQTMDEILTVHKKVLEFEGKLNETD